MCAVAILRGQIGKAGAEQPARSVNKFGQRPHSDANDPLRLCFFRMRNMAFLHEESIAEDLMPAVPLRVLVAPLYSL